MKHLFSILSLLFSVALTSLLGCGYTLQGTGSVLPPDVKKIYIPFAENDSTEGSFGNILTESLRDQFERFGAVEVTDKRLGADAELITRIKSVKRTTRAVTNTTDIAQQFDTAVVIDVRLVKKNGTMLWGNPNLQVSSAVAASQAGLQAGSASFAGGLTTDSSLARLDPRQFIRSQEQTALEQIALTASQTIYNQAVAPDF
jgi:hypothetical protein